MHHHTEHHHYHTDLRSLRIAIAISVAIIAVQIVGSVISSSLALLSDSAHVAVDIASLLTAYVGLRIAQRRTQQQRFTYGWRRVEILAALLNGLALLLICTLIAVEAIERLQAPRLVYTTPMLIAASIGFIGNGIAWYVLRPTTHLTTRSAYFHVLNDMLSSVAVIIGGVTMRYTGWQVLDPMLSLLIAFFVARSGVHIVHRAVVILMESTPEHLNLEQVRTALHEHPHVEDVHDLHLWQIGATTHAMSAHIVVDSAADRDQTLAELQQMLNERFGIAHATLQLEGAPFAQSQTCQRCDRDHSPSGSVAA